MRCLTSRLFYWAIVVSTVLSISAAAYGFANAPQSNSSNTSTIHSATDAGRTRSRVHSHRRRVHRHVATKNADTAPTPTQSPQPVPPAHQPAVPATVHFAGGQLQIDARNSSLSQILAKVSSETGLVVDGLSNDERIYGQYGPGSVSSTLTALLNGAGYNYVIVGSEGNGKMKLLLTQRNGSMTYTASAPAPNKRFMNPVDTQTPATVNPSEPPHPKTPQEIFEELRRMHPPPPQ